MLSSVTSWLGSVAGDSKTEDQEGNQTQIQPKQEDTATLPTSTMTVDTPSVQTGDNQADENASRPKQEESQEQNQGGEPSKEPNGPSIEEQLEEVSTKAISTAKEWGSYLYSFGRAATEQVAKTAVDTAKNLKTTVEEKTILGHFNKEQEKFVNEQREKKTKSEAAVPPWVGYNEEEAMKSQILALSADKRNFLRNPPSGVQFQFDFETSYPVAMVMLTEDPALKAMRFELVPKQVKEDMFWRNYFYRVSLIKQSAQLSTLAQETGSSGENGSNKSSRRSSTDSGKGKSAEVGIPNRGSGPAASKEEEMSAGSPPEHEFVSDTYQDGQLSQDELRMLGVTDGKEATSAEAEEVPEWERELAAELQEYEVVDDGSPVDDTDLEKEILQQIEAEAGQ